jgi:hypothetical protein
MFEAYHGVTGAQHQANFNRLSGHGYRMISLVSVGKMPLFEIAAHLQRATLIRQSLTFNYSNSFSAFGRLFSQRSLPTGGPSALSLS